MCRREHRTHDLLRARQMPTPIGCQLPRILIDTVLIDKVGRSFGTLQTPQYTWQRRSTTWCLIIAQHMRIISRKLDNAFCTRTCKHTRDRLLDTKANWIYLIWKKEPFSNPEWYNWQPWLFWTYSNMNRFFLALSSFTFLCYHNRCFTSYWLVIAHHVNATKPHFCCFAGGAVLCNLHSFGVFCFCFVFRCLISFTGMELLWVQTWTISQSVHFPMYYKQQGTNFFFSNATYDLVAFAWRILSSTVHNKIIIITEIMNRDEYNKKQTYLDENIKILKVELPSYRKMCLNMNTCFIIFW